MLEDTMLVKVTNISSGTAGYSIPELSINRRFTKGESKEISVKELRALNYTPGGLVMMKDYLSVSNDELLREFGINAEPEYNWGAAEVTDLLLNKSVERLEDALEFAPTGIVDLIKNIAVEINLNDMSKRQAILEATKFNVTNAINIKNMDTPVEADDKPSGRRVPVEEETKEDGGVPHIKTSYRRVN